MSNLSIDAIWHDPLLGSPFQVIGTFVRCEPPEMQENAGIRTSYNPVFSTVERLAVSGSRRNPKYNYIIYSLNAECGKLFY